MILALPSGLHIDIRDDVRLLQVCHEVFYRHCYGCLNIKAQDVVLDCGANVGFFTLYAFSQNPSLIIAVEPSLENYMGLQKNVKMNCGDLKIKLLNLAVYSSHDELVLYGEGPEANLYRCRGRKQKVESATIDELEKYLNVQFDVLKIDVEGAEVEVLRGGANSLKHVRELCLEFHSERLRDECVKLLASYGFQSYLPKVRRDFTWLRGYILMNLQQILLGSKASFIDTLEKRISNDDAPIEWGILYSIRK